MRTNASMTILFICLIVSGSCSTLDDTSKKPQAVHGVLDLRGYDFDVDGPIELNGEWEFYWNLRLEPIYFTPWYPHPAPQYLEVPGSWQKLTVDGTPLPRSGVATYRLIIRIDPQRFPLELDISETGKAYQLFFNGLRPFSRGDRRGIGDRGDRDDRGDRGSNAGIVGTSAETTVPVMWSSPTSFSVIGDSIDVILQVANFHGEKGGIENHIVLGRSISRSLSQVWFQFSDIFIFGTLFIMGLYHLGLYLFNRKYISPLYFNIVCFFLASYMFLDAPSLQRLMPWDLMMRLSNWTLRSRLATVFLFAPIPFFSMFIRSLYPREFATVFLRIVQIATAICLLAVFITPIYNLYLVKQALQIIAFTVGLYLLYILIKAAFNKREGSIMFLTGYIILLGAGITGAFDVRGSITLVPAAVIVFIITQAIFMSYRFSNTLRTTERQSVALLKEISDRQRAEEQSKLQQQQLIQADKMASLGILVSGVAHEINNPNNFILLNSEMLSKSWDDMAPVLAKHHETHNDFSIAGIPYLDARDRIRQLITGIGDGAKRIERIITVLRDFSRQETGEGREPVNINEVVNAALLILSNLVRKSTYHLTLELDQNLPVVSGSFQRLEQVIINLITNACQALPGPDRGLTITTTHNSPDGYVVIEIHDEGTGIPQENLSHIMDPFFTTKRDDGGTGLGLSISYTIIKEHSGDIIFKSSPETGTTVTVILPAIATEGV